MVVCEICPEMEMHSQISQKYNWALWLIFTCIYVVLGQHQNLKINRNDVMLTKLKNYIDFVPIGR